MTGEGWLAECEREATALPRETRQRFLDLIWLGVMLETAALEVGITVNAANGIMAGYHPDEVRRLQREAK